METGKVTDIGTIILYPQSLGDKYKNIAVRSPTNLPFNSIEPYAPSVIDIPPVDTAWVDDEYDKERVIYLLPETL